MEFPLNGLAEDLTQVKTQRERGITGLDAEVLAIRIAADGTRHFLIQRRDFYSVLTKFSVRHFPRSNL